MDNDTPDIVRIPLSKKGKYKGKYEVVVSFVDSDLSIFNWHVDNVTNVDKPLYALRVVCLDDGKPLKIRMHRLILERKLGRVLRDNEIPDHINGNGLDNRRGNLRVATVSQNNQNRSKQRNNTSNFKGVSWNKYAKKWHSRIWVNKQRINLGYFDTPEDAAKAYLDAQKKYHGEFANNKISNL